MTLWLPWTLHALGCTGEDSLRFQEQWELLALDRDRAVLDVRMSRSNTAALKGTPKVRAELITPQDGVVRFGFEGVPADFEALDGGLRIGPDLLRGHGSGWELQLQEGAEYGVPRDLRLAMGTSGDPGQVLQVSEGWEVQPLELLGQAHGFLSSGGVDRMINGRGVVFHRAGPTPPTLARGETRTTLVVLGADLSIGIDQTGTQAISWALIDGTLAWGDALLSGDFDAGWSLDFSPELPVQIQVKTRKEGYISSPHEHLSRAELAALDLGKGSLLREVRSGRARIQVGELTREAGAVVVQTRWE